MRLHPADELSELLNLDQAARLANVSRRTLDRWIASRRLRVYEVRGHTGRYVREDELLEVERERRRSRRRGRPGARVNVA
ncbi:helix-turn-helix domain-containing protein [Actinomadura sp. KC216]|uniref:helix-turn-helix domain-containing protein n=1 Tax=Actinomadura sp. KC216 TaxID=2530370 RepID=UPI0014048556|nr:helix-turn-helix domain-containing protein [Actinomadura sp. KC216]